MIEIFIPSSGTIDVSENEAFPITWNIADIRNPDKRNANYTKTLKLPGTANNNRMFGWLFDVNVQANRFNPNLKVRCVVLNDSIPILEGNIQLLSISVKDEKDITYECTVMGNTVDLFTNIGNLELRDLDLSAYNHAFTYSNIYNSWSAPVGAGYVYPQIDYGYYDVNNLVLEEDFKPAVYVKTYLDKIINNAGFTHSSSFLNTDFFKRLIVPFNGDVLKIANTTVTNARVVASVQGSKIVGGSGSSGSYLNLSANSETTDPTNQYNGTQFTAAVTGKYNIRAVHRFSFKYTATTVHNPVNIFPEILKNGTIIQQDQLILATTNTTPNSIYYAYPLLTSPSIGSETDTFTFIREMTVDLNANDTIVIRTLRQSGYNGIALQYETGSSVEFNLQPGNIVVGTQVAINETIPEKIKQKDFLMSVINHFNLYVDVDKTNPKRLIIEPRNDFYSSGTTVDWSSKWDSLQGWTLLPMGALEANEYHYTYKDDNDYFNDDYKKKWDLTYGKKEWKINNDYIKSIKSTELIFSPTPLVKRGDRVFSTIIKKDSSGNTVKTKHNIRILYYGGLKSCMPYNIKVKSGGMVSNNLTTYPYAGHLDDPNWPTLDLNFGTPREVYYSIDPFIYTDNNSFNRFYKNFIEEITDENSKIAQGKFNLSPYDLQSFDFRNKVFVDNAYWRVNKIDFDPSKDSLAEAELIKIKNIPTFVPSSGTVLSSSGETFLPYDAEPISRQGNTFGDNHLVRGYNIFVADNAINVIATGEYINIGDSKNVTVLNSSGVTVAGGLTNVHVVNSSGITITESNVTYVDGVQVDNSNLPYVPYVGASGTVDLGTNKILIGNGSVSAPSLAFSGTTNTGLWKNTTYNSLSWGSGGTYGGLFEASGLYVKSTGVFAFQSSDLESASADLLLRRDAARTLRIGQNGGAGQNKLRIQGDATDYIELTNDGTNSIISTTSGAIVLSGGSIAAGTSSPNASALVDLTSTTQGLLLPRMTATQGSAITGVDGLMIYVTSTNGTFTSVGFWGYENGAWIKL